MNRLPLLDSHVSVCTGHISSARAFASVHPSSSSLYQTCLSAFHLRCAFASLKSRIDCLPSPSFLPVVSYLISRLLSFLLLSLLLSYSLTLCRLSCVRSVSLSVFAFPFRSVQVLHFLFCEELSFCAARFDENMRGREIGEWRRYAERAHTMKQFEVANAAMLMILSRENEKNPNDNVLICSESSAPSLRRRTAKETTFGVSEDESADERSWTPAASLTVANSNMQVSQSAIYLL